MDARCIRIKIFADTKISGYVWTGPKSQITFYSGDSNIKIGCSCSVLDTSSFLASCVPSLDSAPLRTAEGPEACLSLCFSRNLQLFFCAVSFLIGIQLVSFLTYFLKMTTAQVVEASVTVNNNSPIQDYVHPDDHTQLAYEMTPVFKPFTQFC